MRTLIAGLLMMVVAAGAGYGEPALQAETRADISLNPRQAYDCSTSAGPLLMHIRCRRAGITSGWSPMIFPGLSHLSTFPILPQTEDLTREEINERLGILRAIYQTSHPSGTHGAYMNLIKGKRDLILVARAPSEDEKVAASTNQVELELEPIARDAFVFIKHHQNKVQNLTTRNIRQIYTGQLTNWKPMGGIDGEIVPFSRNRNSGSQELMQSLVMKDRTPISSEDLMGMTMMGPFNQLHGQVRGIGYTVFYYQQRMNVAPEIQLFAVDGVLPSRETIASGEYPYVTEVYAVIRADEPDDSEARELYNWLLTEEGQQVVAETGYVPVGS